MVDLDVVFNASEIWIWIQQRNSFCLLFESYFASIFFAFIQLGVDFLVWLEKVFGNSTPFFTRVSTSFMTGDAPSKKKKKKEKIERKRGIENKKQTKMLFTKNRISNWNVYLIFADLYADRNINIWFGCFVMLKYSATFHIWYDLANYAHSPSYWNTTMHAIFSKVCSINLPLNLFIARTLNLCAKPYQVENVPFEGRINL